MSFALSMWLSELFRDEWRRREVFEITKEYTVRGEPHLALAYGQVWAAPRP